MISLIACILLCSNIINIYSHPPPIDRPDQVIILFRHGSRAPTTNTYDPTWPSYAVGELTPAGMRQHFTLGLQLRKEYFYLNLAYDSDNFYVRSTNLNRTIMSAESFLLGFFGSDSGPNLTNLNSEFNMPPHKIDNNIRKKIQALGLSALPFNYKPIPIHVVENSQDYLLYASNLEACPLFAKMDIVDKNQKLRKFEILMKPTLDNIINILNDSSLTLNDLPYVWDTIHCNLYAGKIIPKKYAELHNNPELWRNLTFIHNYLFYVKNVGRKQQIQLLSINYFNEIMDLISNYSKGLNTQQLLVYSASDTTMAPFLAALNISNVDCLMSNFLNETNFDSCVAPDFASQFIIEFYNNTTPNESEIVIYYNDNLQNICKTKNGRCPMNKFFEILKGITQGKGIDYYMQTCNNIDPIPNQPHFHSQPSLFSL